MNAAEQVMAHYRECEEPLFAVRCKIPGGDLSATQYLALDALADRCGNGDLRITSRQSLQFYGVAKARLSELVRGIHDAGLTSWGAGGDVVRNIAVTAVPLPDTVESEVRQLVNELTMALTAENSAYCETWLGGEQLPLGKTTPPDPLYQQAYLPQKFKLAVAVPPSNDVDVYAHDLGFVAHVPNGSIEGYTVLAGGGMGMDLERPKSRPVLAQPLFFIQKERAVESALAVLAVFRDFGNRVDRKRARLKYLIEDKGLEWFREQIQLRLKAAVESPKVFRFTHSTDPLGWHSSSPDRLFFGLWVEGGRIRDESVRCYRRGLRAILTLFGCPLRVTCNHNILFRSLVLQRCSEFDAVLKEHGLCAAETLTTARQTGMACVGLPTCEFAVAESERIYRAVMARIDKLLLELGLEKEPLLFRMTGCSNGCARPYLADFAFVGHGPGRYAVCVGGSCSSGRLASLIKTSVSAVELSTCIRPVLQGFVAKRQGSETFSTYWGRVNPFTTASSGL